MFNDLTPALVRAIGVFVVMLVSSVIVVSVSYVYMDGINQDQLSAKRAMRIWQSKN